MFLKSARPARRRRCDAPRRRCTGAARRRYGALRRLAQWSAERHHAATGMQHLKQDRQLDRTLAFTGKGE